MAWTVPQPPIELLETAEALVARIDALTGLEGRDRRTQGLLQDSAP